MKIQHNIELKSKTTFHVGGIAKNFYIPESDQDLINLLDKLKDKKLYILSGGSNLIINDQKVFENVIYMSDIDKNIKQIKDNIFYIGCSLRIQEVINTINKLNYGGIEKLYSLPAMFGGIIYMNAGIGGATTTVYSISDFIVRVKVINIETRKIEWINKEDCNFSYRKSLFQNDKYIILGAECKFIKQGIEVSKQIIRDRLSFCKEKQEMGQGAFGTCFSTGNGRLLRIVSILKKKKGNVHFSKNNCNWFVNDGGGSYHDIIYLINKCKKIHKIFHQDIECEVRIWD